MAKTAQEVARFLYEQRDNPDTFVIWGDTGNPMDDAEVRAWMGYYFHGLCYDRTGNLKIGEGMELKGYHRLGRLLFDDGGDGLVIDPAEIVDDPEA